MKFRQYPLSLKSYRAAGGEDALRCGKLLTKGEFDKMIRPREKMANGSLPKMQPGHNFLRRISLSQHLILLQVLKRLVHACNKAVM